MAILKSTGEALVADGDISAGCRPAFEKGLELLRVSGAEAPVVDLSRVTYIGSREIGLLVTLWVDLVDRGTHFDLKASDRVWAILERAGVARVFFHRPK